MSVELIVNAIKDTFVITEIHLDDGDTIQIEERKNTSEFKEWILERNSITQTIKVTCCYIHEFEYTILKQIKILLKLTVSTLFIR